MEKGNSIFAVICVIVFAAGFFIASTLTPASTTVVEKGLFFDNWLTVQVCHADGTCEAPIKAKNKVTLEGLNWTRDVLGGLTGCPGQAVNGTCYVNWTYIELSTNTTTPTGNEQNCTGVVTGNNLGVGLANRTYKQGTGNYTAEKVFNVLGTQNGIQRVCLSNNSLSNADDLMALALLPAAVNVANGDTLNITYSVAAVAG